MATTLAAFAEKTIIPPDQWWGEPSWSPDSGLIAVQSPPPERYEHINPSDGKKFYGYKGDKLDLEPDTVLIKAKDNSVVGLIGHKLESSEWSSDAKILATTSIENCRAVLAIFTGENGLPIKKELTNEFASLAWAPNSHRLIVSQSEKVTIYDLDNLQTLELEAASGEHHWMKPCWSPDGSKIASLGCFTGVDGEPPGLRIWNGKTGKVLKDLANNSILGSALWSRDGKYLLHSQAGSICVVDGHTFKSIKSIKTHQCANLQVSPSGTQIGYEDQGSLHVIDTQSLREKLKLQGSKCNEFSFSWSPDERYILIQSRETIAICDAGSGKFMEFAECDDLSRAYWTPDGKSIVLAMKNSPPIIVHRKLPDLTLPAATVGSPGWEYYPRPKTLADCFSEFDKALPPEKLKRFRDADEQSICCFGGGSTISDSLMSNPYHSWDLTDLHKFFKKLGIADCRDVFAIVLDSYWRHLHGKPIQFDEQVKHYKAFWDQQKPVISENRPVPPELLDLKGLDQHAGAFTIGSTKAKLKIVTFIGTDESPNLPYLKKLLQLRLQYPSKSIAFVIFAMHFEPFVPTDLAPSALAPPSKEIAKFEENPDKSILVSSIPTGESEKLLQFICAGKMKYYPPQSLVIVNGNHIKLRINGMDQNEAEQALEKELAAVK
jgi:Tol biopolymer transport system component